MDKKIGTIGLMIYALFSQNATAQDSAQNWNKRLCERMEKLAASFQGELDFFVKDLSSAEECASSSEEPTYLASGVKIPIAIELLRRVEQGKLSLDKKIKIKSSDYIDGNGETNYLKPGSMVSLRFLLEQMLIHSDNTASDLLIGELGLNNINASLRRMVPKGFYDITTLADVRRHAYSGIHPRAFELKNSELITVKGPDNSRVRKLASLLQLKPEEAAGKSLDAAFSTYYASHLNSAYLPAFGELLRQIAQGEALKEAGTESLLGIMSRVETGKNRIKAGLGREFVWAHKTGTQYSRVCDFGLAWARAQPEKKVVIAACGRGFSKREQAETALRLLGKAVKESGVFAALSL